MGFYWDDGYSGTNFERPEFKRMMSDIEIGKVNCVIVKDLSRLGRDYIETGRLIQKIFPSFHVRFIAVTDHFDSKTADYNMKSLVVPVKSFINDSYCRDISQKVKSQQKAKMEQGKYIGAFTVYGYRKLENDKNKLCPDGYSAEVVKNIFAWKLEGMSSLAIARRLNELGIPSPMEYKKIQGKDFSTGFMVSDIPKWSSVTIKRILTNELYAGVMVQGKTEKVNYKVKKSVMKPKEKWIRAEGMHQAIVSREDFEIVQKLLDVDIRAAAETNCSHLFSGILFCGDCKKTMIRRVNRYKNNSKSYFICSTKNKGQGCSRHSISEEDLKGIVFKIIQVYVSIFLYMDTQLEHIRKMKVDFEEIAKFYGELKRLHQDKHKYLKLQSELYEDLKNGLITESDCRDFCSIYRKKYVNAEETQKKQEDMIKQLFYNAITSGIKLERLKKSRSLLYLDRDMILTFINKIEVFENKKIHVEFRTKQEFHMY